MAKKKGVLDILEEDHEKVRGLLDRLENTSERGVKSRERILDELHRDLEVHTMIEEEIVYPAFRREADTHDSEEMYFEFVEEHFLAGEAELPRLIEVDASSIEFSAKAIVLKELVTHHIDEEEQRMFPLVRELFDEDQQAELGRRVMERKRELLREMKKAA